MSEGWWLEQLREQISQGDVYDNVPFSLLVEPLTHLRYADGPKKTPAWAENPDPVQHKATQRAHILSAYRPAPGILLTHDCEIDKAKTRPRWLLAPVLLIKDLKPGAQTQVLTQKHLALVPLPGLGALGDCFADLRNMTTIPEVLVKGNERLGSMTDVARLRLEGYLVAFLLRKNVPDGAE